MCAGRGQGADDSAAAAEDRRPGRCQQQAALRTRPARGEGNTHHLVVISHKGRLYELAPGFFTFL